VLGPDESLVTTLARDEATLNYLNVTHTQVADVLEAVYADATTRQQLAAQFTVCCCAVQTGYYRSPFQHTEDTTCYGGSSIGDRDITVVRRRDNAKLHFGQMLIDMIRYNGFFGGCPQAGRADNTYRLDPETVIRFFLIQPGVNYSIRRVSHSDGTTSNTDCDEHQASRTRLQLVSQTCSP